MLVSHGEQPTVERGWDVGRCRKRGSGGREAGRGIMHWPCTFSHVVLVEPSVSHSHGEQPTEERGGGQESRGREGREEGTTSLTLQGHWPWTFSHVVLVEPNISH